MCDCAVFVCAPTVRTEPMANQLNYLAQVALLHLSAVEEATARPAETQSPRKASREKVRMTHTQHGSSQNACPQNTCFAHPAAVPRRPVPPSYRQPLD